MKILLYSRYGHRGASSRMRSYQFFPLLKSQGHDITVQPFYSDAYLDALYSGRNTLRFRVIAYLRRLASFLRLTKYDLVWIEGELFPFFPATFERLFKRVGLKYVVDYDDALFHRYDMHRSSIVRRILGAKIDQVMKDAAHVVAGNRYLAQRASSTGQTRITIVPTTIDLERYSMKPETKSNVVTVGWIGSPSTTKNLMKYGNVLGRLHAEGLARFVAVGASEKVLKDLPIQCQDWTEDSEVESIHQFDIGIMPLVGDAFDKGKCGFKLIQYMACGLPIVASPIGVNCELVTQGANGYLAEDTEDWEVALRNLIADAELRKRFGQAGRRRVEGEFTLQVQGPILSDLLKATSKKSDESASSK